MSLDAKRPKPVFPTGALQFSTKKEKKSIYRSLKSVPKAPPRSCPVPRILYRSAKNSPRVISFTGDANESILFESQSYNTKKGESYFEQCFIIEDKLGAGSFGEVYKVRNKDDGKIYACKKSILKYRGEKDRLQRIEEVRKLQQLPRHPNCVEFFKAWEENLHLYMLTEACNSSLSEITSKKRLNDAQVWAYIVDILEGLNHLHANKLIHMDLKPDNIFVGMDGLCKIGDFGLVIDYSDGAPREAMEGDPRYLAPECLQFVFTPAADMFSFGITILELATDLDLPTQGLEWHELRKGNLPEVTKEICPDLKQLITYLLNPNPHERFSSAQLLQWPVIQKKSSRRRFKQYLQTGVVSLHDCVQPLFSWVTVILSLVSSFVSWFKIFKYKRKENCDVTPDKMDESYLTEPSYNASRSIGDLPDFSSEDESDALCFSPPIINSTPISTLQGTRSLKLKNSLWRNTHTEREGDHSSKNSDLLVLEASDVESEPPPAAAVDEETCNVSILRTSRNLLHLFNRAQDDDSEDEGGE